MQTRAVVIDIEGTIAPIAFVRDVLFPYARTRMGAFLAQHGDDSEVAEAMATTRRLAPGEPVEATLDEWMAHDVKATPLKTLQGLIWQAGYEQGDLTGELYPEVPAVLRAWGGQGIELYIYSSGSVAAQRLLLSHTRSGDLTALFAGFFDTRIGGKRAAESYRAIAHAVGREAGECLFLSDVPEELAAAAEAGFRGCQLVREADGTQAAPGYPHAADLHGVPLS